MGEVLYCNIWQGNVIVDVTTLVWMLLDDLK